MRKRSGNRPESLPAVLGLIQQGRERPNTTLAKYAKKSLAANTHPARRTALWRARRALSLLDSETISAVQSTDFSLQLSTATGSQTQGNFEAKRRSIIVKMPVIVGIAEIARKIAVVRPKSPEKLEIREQETQKMSLFCRWMRFRQEEKPLNRQIS